MSRALERAAQLVASGEKNASAIEADMRKILSGAGISRIDYAALADPETLAERSIVEGPTIALVAAHVGATRLIDNRVLNS